MPEPVAESVPAPMVQPINGQTQESISPELVSVAPVFAAEQEIMSGAAEEIPETPKTPKKQKKNKKKFKLWMFLVILLIIGFTVAAVLFGVSKTTVAKKIEKQLTLGRSIYGSWNTSRPLPLTKKH